MRVDFLTGAYGILSAMKLAVIWAMRPCTDIMYKNFSSGVKISRFGQI